MNSCFYCIVIVDCFISSIIFGFAASGYQQQYVVKPQKSKSGGILGSNTGKLAAGKSDAKTLFSFKSSLVLITILNMKKRVHKLHGLQSYYHFRKGLFVLGNTCISTCTCKLRFLILLF